MKPKIIILTAAALVASFSAPTLAENGAAWPANKVVKSNKDDPCAAENAKYPWGLSPCKIEQKRKESLMKPLDPQVMAREEKIYHKRNKYNKTVPIGNR